MCYPKCTLYSVHCTVLRFQFGFSGKCLLALSMDCAVCSNNFNTRFVSYVWRYLTLILVACQPLLKVGLVGDLSDLQLRSRGSKGGGGIRQLTVLHFCREKLNRTVNYQRRLISAAAALFFSRLFAIFALKTKLLFHVFPFRQISYDFCKKFAQILIHFHVS